jgi:hypothetical protein
LLVQWQTDPSATDPEKKVAAELTALIQELDRAYVAAVSLMVLSYGESLPYTEFDDWPQSGQYGLSSGTAILDQLRAGVVPLPPTLDAQTFPILFQDLKGRGFPRSITQGLDWLDGYDAMK